MKPKLLVIAVAVTFVASSGVMAGEGVGNAKQTKKQAGLQTKSSQPRALQKEPNAAPTGSYIKRDIHRSGMITDGPNPLYVIDQRAIQTSGAADLGQVLLHTGFRR
jgi:hypothetical protein